MNYATISSAFLLAVSLSSSLAAQTVEVKNAWVRATVQGQKATGAFMTLTAKSGASLVGVSTPVANVAEVHEMKIEGDVMKMRAMPKGLNLPAGQSIALNPGGYHLMLMDLKLPLKADTTIPLTLIFRDSKGVESKTELRVPVSRSAPSNAMSAEHKHH